MSSGVISLLLAAANFGVAATGWDWAEINLAIAVALFGLFLVDLKEGRV